MPNIVIRNIETQEVVREIDVTGKSERDISKIEWGLLRQIDTERFVFSVE